MQQSLSLSAKILGFLFLTVILSATELHADPADQVARLYQESDRPILVGRGSFFADIDTVDQVIYALVYEELWSYDLKEQDWDLLHTFDNEVTDELFEEPKEFGFDQVTGDLYLWSIGVGLVYRIDLQNYEVSRIDQSFPHKNQYGHVPFFRDGMIYAFGGYGLWQNKNLITHFMPELREWKIVTPSEDSPFPPVNAQGRGVYIEDRQTFYTYGGVSIKNRLHDDSHSNRTWTNELWMFDFNTMKWSFVMEPEPFNGSFFNNSAIETINGISRNSFSSTAYSQATGNWYIPVHKPESSLTSAFLKVFNLENHTEFKVAELDTTVNEAMFATHFLFDQKTEELILLGYRNITNKELYPVIVLKIPEDRIIEKLEPVGMNKSLLYASIFAVGAFLLLGLLYFKFGSSIPAVNGKQSISKEELEEELNGTERSLLQTLWEIDHMPETSELEELVWPNVDNYDYRRKLRNETIRSVNEKVQKNFGVREKLIIREKDKEDNRRFRYGIREGVLV